MADWLSEEWAQQVAALAGSRPPVPGANGTVSLAISDGRGSEVSYHWSYRDGIPGDGGVGGVADADLALTITRADAEAVAVRRGGAERGLHAGPAQGHRRRCPPAGAAGVDGHGQLSRVAPAGDGPGVAVAARRGRRMASWRAGLQASGAERPGLQAVRLEPGPAPRTSAGLGDQLVDQLRIR